jgi:hypothetical protein
MTACYSKEYIPTCQLKSLCTIRSPGLYPIEQRCNTVSDRLNETQPQIFRGLERYFGISSDYNQRKYRSLRVQKTCAEHSEKNQHVPKAAVLLQFTTDIKNHGLRKSTSSLVMSVRLSVRPHGTLWLPVDGFS